MTASPSPAVARRGRRRPRDGRTPAPSLRARGFVLVVVTNQPDVARGLQSASGVAAINALVRAEIDVDAVYVCPHDDPRRVPVSQAEARDAAGCGPGPRPRPLTRALWSATAGPTSWLVRGLDAAPCILSTAIRKRGPTRPTRGGKPGRGDRWILRAAPLEEGGSVRSTSLRHQDLR